jgi:hypothetical protein
MRKVWKKKDKKLRRNESKRIKYIRNGKFAGKRVSENGVSQGERKFIFRGD